MDCPYCMLNSLPCPPSQAAGLASTLSDPSLTATVFAPTDAAFSKALKALKLSSAEALSNPPLLAGILSYHLLPQAFSSAQLGSGKYGEVETLLEGESLIFSKTYLSSLLTGEKDYKLVVIPSGGPPTNVSSGGPQLETN